MNPIFINLCSLIFCAVIFFLSIMKGYSLPAIVSFIGVCANLYFVLPFLSGVFK